MLAHSFDLALPHELTLEQNIFLMKDFVREQFVRKGFAVDWAVHAPDPRGDDRNFHSHVLVPLRKVDGQSFGNKVRYSRSDLRQQNIVWRKAWENLVNRHLARYGHKAKIDARSLKDQGSKRAPSKHHGVRSKAKRSSLDAIRSPMPKAPVVRISKTTGTDGTITVKASIQHSGLNNIGNPTPPPFFPAKPDRKGWPPEAVRDWEAWGHQEVVKFFTLWKELSPSNFQPK